MTSKVARNFARQQGAKDAGFGFVADPLKLPYAKILQEARRIRVSDAYRRMVACGACALTCGQQEALYLDTIRGLDAHDLDVIVRAFQQLVEDMDARPFLDILGPVYMEIAHKLDRDAGGEFFTPHALCRLLAKMGMQELTFRPGEVPTANEPASGTGAIVLAWVEEMANRGMNPLNMRWTLQDISATSCYGAFINTTLWGIPATVVCGDTLRLTQHWAWRNIHWHQAIPRIPAEEDVLREQDMLRRVGAMSQFFGRPLHLEARS